MSSKIKFISIFCFFVFCFFIFFQSLKESKKYTPKALMDKKIINFKMKQLESDEIITENDIFEINKITLLNISTGFHSVVVCTSTWLARGPRFKSRQSHFIFLFLIFFRPSCQNGPKFKRLSGKNR